MLGRLNVVPVDVEGDDVFELLEVHEVRFLFGGNHIRPINAINNAILDIDCIYINTTNKHANTVFFWGMMTGPYRPGVSEKETIHLREAPEKFVRLTSGLGDCELYGLQGVYPPHGNS
jgi:hypothetical protein